MHCVVMLSGGLDSLVAAARAQREHRVLLALTADYGQRAAAREIGAARAQAEWLGCHHEVVELPWLGALGGSALTEPEECLPSMCVSDLDAAGAAEASAGAVWVPNRNGVLVNVAAAYAERRRLEAVVCGFNAEEAATFPDNSGEFVQAAERLWEFSTRSGVKLLAPLVDMDKEQIVAQGMALDAPLYLVWSCYEEGEQQCWHCESCLRLRRALEQNEAWDSYVQKVTERSQNWT